MADISGNHGGFLEKANELIETAAICGCDYAKFQYYSPGEMFDNDNMDLYRKLAVPRDWLASMFDTAHHNGIGLFASIFSVDLLEHLLPFSPNYIKLASPQSTWLPTRVYREIVAITPKTISIVASADDRDVDRLWTIMRDAGRSLQCLYCPPGHPPTITDGMLDEFTSGCYYGFSDHTTDLQAPLAFAHAGAEMIEKHLKLDDNCVDAMFSANAVTMGRLCEMVK